MIEPALSGKALWQDIEAARAGVPHAVLQCGKRFILEAKKR
jgi:hypothetical protein